MRKLEIEILTFPIRGAFVIARGSRTSTTVVVTTIRDGSAAGRGEGGPTRHYGETPESVVAQIEGARRELERGADRQALLGLLPAPPATRSTRRCGISRRG